MRGSVDIVFCSFRLVLILFTRSNLLDLLLCDAYIRLDFRCLCYKNAFSLRLTEAHLGRCYIVKALSTIPTCRVSSFSCTRSEQSTIALKGRCCVLRRIGSKVNDVLRVTGLGLPRRQRMLASAEETIERLLFRHFSMADPLSSPLP